MASASDAAAVFQAHRDELGFVNEAQCREGDLYTVERDGQTVGAALANHCVRKPQTTLYELAVLPEYRREGIAGELIQRLAAESPHEKIVAKCPANLPANDFYAATGWTRVGQEDGKNRDLNVWERPTPPVDRITTGRPDLTAVAERYGWLRGTRLDELRRYERRGESPAFIDMHWSDPDFQHLLAATRHHRPRYVIAGDYERDDSNIGVVNERAERLRPHAENVIVVPKAPGQLDEVPEWAVVGYSTPTDYGGTDIPRRRYRDINQPIHVLGGTPADQFEMLGDLWTVNVQSVDTNSIHKAATRGAKAWQGAPTVWRRIDRDGPEAVVEAYQESVENLTREFANRGLAHQDPT